MVKTHVEESLGANPADAALNPADRVAMGLHADEAQGFLASSRGRAFRALAHRPYRLLFAAFMVNQTGFWISHIAMQGLMANLRPGDPLSLGMLFFALFIPAFAVAPLAGLAADRFDRKRMMLASYMSVALLSALLALLVGSGAISAPLLLLVALGLGTSFAFAGPASFSLAANAVPAPDLASAVSLQSAANNLTRVVGPMLAAPILTSARFEWAFAVFVVTAGVAACLIAAMQVAPREQEAEDGGILARLGAGWVHARERRPALPALLMVATLSLFGVSHAAVLPVFATEMLGSVDAFAWMVVASGAGAMLGALSIGYREPARDLRSAALLMGVYGAALGVFAITRSLAAAMACQFAIGWTYFAIMTGLQTLVQGLVDESRRGRVMSLFQVAWAGIVPFGGLLMGASATWLGVTPALGLSAAVCTLYALGVWLASR